jgi:hypothetical protein
MKCRSTAIAVILSLFRDANRDYFTGPVSLFLVPGDQGHIWLIGYRYVHCVGPAQTQIGSQPGRFSTQLWICRDQAQVRNAQNAF